MPRLQAESFFHFPTGVYWQLIALFSFIDVMRLDLFSTSPDRRKRQVEIRFEDLIGTSKSEDVLDCAAS